MKYRTLIFLSLFLALPTFTSADESFSFTLDREIFVTIKKTRFNPQNHKIEYYGEGNTKYPYKIDGVEFQPNDFDMPYEKVDEFRVEYRGETYFLDVSGVYDMRIPPRNPGSVLKAKCSQGVCRLFGLFGDGAGVFMAEWEFGKGKSKRLRLSADENDTFPLVGTFE
jgi:hypothetical protein